MIITAGQGMLSIVRVVNNLESKIDKVTFTYNDGSTTNVKNIKSKENKQTGISTIYAVKRLVMSINDSKKEYLIKEKLDKSYSNLITITINGVNGDDYDFSIVEGEN